MDKEIYTKPDYQRMLDWVYEVLDPYIIKELFPKYANSRFDLMLKHGGADHTRQIFGQNTNPTEALRQEDLSRFGGMLAVLIARFGEQLWTPNNTRYESNPGKVYVVKHTVGGNANYKW